MRRRAAGLISLALLATAGTVGSANGAGGGVGAAPGPTPYLVRNIGPGSDGSFPTSAVALGRRLVFAAYEPGTGLELWVSDGTRAGTRPLDVLPGAAGLNPSNLVSFRDRVYFAGTDDHDDTELWVSNGTVGGTHQLKELNTFGSSFPQPTASRGRLFVSADGSDGVSSIGDEPWVSDGTAAGTRLLGDLAPGGDSSTPAYFQPAGPGRTIFTAHTTSSGNDLWSTDGTPEGTFPLELNDGTGQGFVGTGATVPGGAVIAGNDGSTGWEPWFTDGVSLAPEHTYPLGNLMAGSTSSNPFSFLPVGDRTYFTANSPDGIGRLFRTDGTAAGTTEIDTGDTDQVTPLARVGGVVYGSARPAVGPTGLFRFAPGDGISVFADLPSGSEPNYSYPAGFRVVRSRLYYTIADEVAGSEVWSTDGTGAGTRRLVDLAPGSEGSEPTPVPWSLGRSVVWSAHRPSTGVELFAFNTQPSTTTADPARAYSAADGRRKRIRVPVAVIPRALHLTGRVVMREGKTVLGTARLRRGTARLHVTRPLDVGVHRVRVSYLGSWWARRSTSDVVRIVVER